MKKIGLLAFVMLGFAQVSGTTEDYSKMSVDELNKALINAVERGSFEKVKGLIQAGADLNQESTSIITLGDCDYTVAYTLLERAAKNGYVDIVKELIRVNAKSYGLDKALILAAAEGHINVVQELIQLNAKGDVIDRALLLTAEEGHTNVVQELINAKAKVNHTDKDGNTALLLAAKNGRTHVLQELINAKANVNHTNNYGDTALLLAAKNGRTHVLQELINAKANVNHTNNNSDTALIVAIKKHNIDAVRMLLKTPGININYADNDGDTALIIAIQWIETTYISGRKDQYNACVNSQNIVKMLLETPGINPHHANKKGDTAIKLLKEKGAF